VVPQYATLKQFMGWPPQRQFNVNFDTAQMKRDISFDTTQELAYEKRIEFKCFKPKIIQHQFTDYYRMCFFHPFGIL
jgi:hypothetical protein